MADTEQATTNTEERQAYYEELGYYNVAPLWEAKGLLPLEPRSRAVPHLWRYEGIRQQLMRAGELITAEEADRRVLMLMNPGLEGEAAAATNLYAGLQLVLPREIAPRHRHTASALRFIVEGSGAYTNVDGEKTLMQPGDLVLTPNWAWHDHGNETDEPMIWLDGLDIPLINAMEASFFEPVGDKQEQTKPVDGSARLFSTGRLNPTFHDWDKRYSPVVNYPWEQTERILRETAEDTDGSPTDGVIFEYTNPYTGGPAVPTMGCYMQLLKPGLHTAAHRHTMSAVYSVAKGNGYSIVDGERLEWGERDTFAVPGWTVHEHVNGSSDEGAILFSFTDDPVLRPLGYYREEPAESQG